MKKAVLFLVFNRLDNAQKVFEQIKLAKPPRLYVASDGARESKVGEHETIEQIRKWILDNIDWDCELKTLFRETNLGCKYAVSSAINWFFSQEEDGMILEDDCVPSQSFFAYCEELLDYYKDDKRIWHIAGENPLIKWENGDASYYFSRLEQCWGWASWADRWQQFDIKMPNFEQAMIDIKKLMPDNRVYKYWKIRFEGCKADQVNSWAYIWTYTILKNNGICINPTRNLITNVGCDGTHAFSNLKKNDPSLNKPIFTIDKIIHPAEVKIDEQAVEKIYKDVYLIKPPSFKEFLLYVKRYPLFFLRKDFWNNFI